MERGVIRNQKFASILRDYSGLQFERGITPTDIDGFVEFNNEVFVFIEAKFGNSPLSYGQRLALERLADCINKTARAIVLIAEHNTGPGEVIDVAACQVRQYRTKGQWRAFATPHTVRQAIDLFREFCNDE